MSINQELRDTLIKFCGMLGSEFDGERANAALKASKLLRQNNLTWVDVLTPCSRTTITAKPECYANHVSLCTQRRKLFDLGIISLREYDFLTGIMRKHTLTDKQAKWVTDIAARVKRADF